MFLIHRKTCDFHELGRVFASKKGVWVREAAVEPAVNGRSTSVLCSISSQCVIARVDMCSGQITEKWLRLWQRETALTDRPWCSSTTDMSASFSSPRRPFQTFRYLYEPSRNYLVILQLLGRALTNWFNNSMQIFTSFDPEKASGDDWIMQSALRPRCCFIHVESYSY